MGFSFFGGGEGGGVGLLGASVRRNEPLNRMSRLAIAGAAEEDDVDGAIGGTGWVFTGNG